MGQPFYAVRDRGRVRPVNQDNALAIALPGGGCLLLVADGVGGARAGEVASAEAMRAASGSLDGSERDPERALVHAVAMANRRVYELSANDAALSGMATTLVMAIIDAGVATIVNVGDSRAYLAAAAGELRALTTDDSWVEQQVRTGAMTREQAERSPYRNAITKGIGVDSVLEIGRPVRADLAAGEALVLCSDGLYRMVSPQVIAGTATGFAPEEAAQRLVTLANEAGGTDNISVAIFRQD